MTGLYVKLDASYHDDPKLCEVSAEAELLYVRVLCYCKRLGNDGSLHLSRVPSVMPMFRVPVDARELLAELTAVGLLQQNGSSWRVVAWLRHNPSPEEIDASREAARIRKQRQRDRSRVSRRDVTGVSRVTERDMSHEGARDARNGTTDERDTQRDTSDGYDDDTISDLAVQPSQSRKSHSVTGHVTRDQPKPKPEKIVRRVRLTDTTLTDALRGIASEHHVNPDTEWPKFVAHHQAKGSVMADWNAAWRTWVLRSAEYGVVKPIRPSAPANRDHLALSYDWREAPE